MRCLCAQDDSSKCRLQRFPQQKQRTRTPKQAMRPRMAQSPSIHRCYTRNSSKQRGVQSVHVLSSSAHRHGSDMGANGPFAGCSEHPQAVSRPSSRPSSQRLAAPSPRPGSAAPGSACFRPGIIIHAIFSLFEHRFLSLIFFSLPAAAFATNCSIAEPMLHVPFNRPPCIGSIAWRPTSATDW